MTGADWQKLRDANFVDERMFGSRLSAAAKFIWLGSFGTLYAAMMAGPGGLRHFYLTEKYLLLAAALFGAFAFVCDVLKDAIGLRFAKRLGLWIENGLKADQRMTGLMATAAGYDAFIAGSRWPSRSRDLLVASVASAAVSAGLLACAVVAAAVP